MPAVADIGAELIEIAPLRRTQDVRDPVEFGLLRRVIPDPA
jgi:hypothetical protein